MPWSLLFALTLTSVHAQTLRPISFDLAVQEAIQAPAYQATESDIRGIELDFASRELALQPTIEVDALRSNEGRQLVSTPSLTFKSRTDTFGALISKPFSTGTTLSVAPSWEHALTPFLSPADRDTVNWQVAISQSLWQDGFGRSTDLRRAREDFQRKQQLATALLQRAQWLVDFEAIYWDWALALREHELDLKNLKRSQEILRWVQDRYRRSAAENSDLLQARALAAQRQLRVATVQQTLTDVTTRIERFIPQRTWQPEPNDLSVTRSIDALNASWKFDANSDVVPLEFIASRNEAGAAGKTAEEVRESFRPRLDLQLAYGKNAVDTDSDSALRGSYQDDHEYSSIGLVFRTGFDLSDEHRKFESAQAKKVAVQQRTEALQAEAKIAWTQLKAQISDQQNQIDRARELVDLQMRKADAERERYHKGRSTAFQAITFEQDAGDAEITLWTLFADLRKMEARARLFAR